MCHSVLCKKKSRIITDHLHSVKDYYIVAHTFLVCCQFGVCWSCGAVSVGRWEGGVKPTVLIMIAREVALIICSAATTLRLVCTSVLCTDKIFVIVTS